MQTEKFRERAWAEVDLTALAHNFLALKSLVSPQTKVVATVKANAYGHGAVQCAKTLLSVGADYLSVATADEALTLRKAGICAPILILGHTDACRMEELIQNDVTMAVFSIKQAQAMSETA